MGYTANGKMFWEKNVVQTGHLKFKMSIRNANGHAEQATENINLEIKGEIQASHTNLGFITINVISHKGINVLMPLKPLPTPSRYCVKDQKSEWNKGAKSDYTSIPEVY